jgi:hypothetical protein
LSREKYKNIYFYYFNSIELYSFSGRTSPYIVPERTPPFLTFASGRRAKQSYKFNFFFELAGKSQAKNRSAL